VSTSSVPAFKLALYNALVALQATTLSGVMVSYGAPFPNPGAEVVWLDDVQGEQVAAFLGRQKRDEDYNLNVIVWVAKQTQSQQVVTERAYVIAGVVETFLRGDPEVSSTVRMAQVKGQFRHEEIISDDGLGRACALSLTINVINRI
jgi:hypothetical protein